MNAQVESFGAYADRIPSRRRTPATESVRVGSGWASKTRITRLWIEMCPGTFPETRSIRINRSNSEESIRRLENVSKARHGQRTERVALPVTERPACEPFVKQHKTADIVSVDRGHPSDGRFWVRFVIQSLCRVSKFIQSIVGSAFSCLFFRFNHESIV